MDVLIRPLEPQDRPAAAELLDDALGAGFWSFDDPDDEIAFVAVLGTRPVGAVLCRLEPAGGPDARLALAGSGAPGGAAGETPGEAPGTTVLHVRAIAVAPGSRRAGLARRLLAHAEEAAASRGSRTAYLFAWLPARRPEPAAVPFYLSAGYAPGPDIPDFYAAGSLASGADCPYCGAPPCRCAARPYTRPLGSL